MAKGTPVARVSFASFLLHVSVSASGYLPSIREEDACRLADWQYTSIALTVAKPLVLKARSEGLPRSCKSGIECVMAIAARFAVLKMRDVRRLEFAAVEGFDTIAVSSSAARLGGSFLRTRQ